MSKGQEYICRLHPLEPYFFCGERDFRFGGQERDAAGKVDYYVASEDLPQQSTLLGTIRFLMLSKAGLLNDGYQCATGEKREQQQSLIGQFGFQAAKEKAKADFGKLYGISPLFLLQIENGKEHRLIHAPLNHKTGDSRYCPLSMGNSTRTERGERSILPLDYNTKKGLTDSWLDLDDANHSIIQRSDIIGTQERTRVGRSGPGQGAGDDGYFKTVYRYLKQDCCFALYCRAEKGTLPVHEVVSMGHGKSVFLFTADETDGTGQAGLEKEIQSLPGCSLASVYYAWSDLFLDLGSDTPPGMAYSITAKRLFRTLDTVEGAKNFKDSRKKSQLFQLIRSGSVFYVHPEREIEFQKALEQPGLKQAGFNFVEKLGGSAQ